LALILTNQAGKEGVEIPWGIKKYLQDPKELFKSLKIMPVGDYEGNVVNFSTDGFIDVRKDKIAVAELRNLNLLDFVDLKVGTKESFVSTVEGLEDDDGSDMERNVPGAEVEMGDNTLLMIEVAVGSFVGILTISLIGLLVYMRRSKRKTKGSSTVSYASSSDEVEGVTETTE
jgi:hypothetical protein